MGFAERREHKDRESTCFTIPLGSNLHSTNPGLHICMAGHMCNCFSLMAGDGVPEGIRPTDLMPTPASGGGRDKNEGPGFLLLLIIIQNNLPFCFFVLLS